MAAPEGLADQVGYIGVGHIVQGDVLHALLRQTAGQDLGGIFRMAVDGAAEDGHGPVLRGVGAPQLVFLQEPANVFPPDGAMEGADHLDVQSGGPLQQRLDLGTVLAHNVGIIPAGIIQPVPLKVHLIGKDVAVQGAESTEGISGKQDFVGSVIGHHDLRPVDHGRHQEREGVAAGGERIPLLYHNGAAGDVAVKELADHGNGLGVGHHLNVRPAAQQLAQSGAVVRLHMVHDHVVQGPSRQGKLQILKEPLSHGLIHRVQQHGLLIQHQIGVVADAPGDGKYIFKLGQPPVRGSQPIQVLVDVRHAVHSMISSFLMRRAQQSGVALISYTALRISSSLAELLQGLRVPFSLLLDGLLQQHILHLYGVSGLANASPSQTVPFIKAFCLPASHPSPRLTTYSHRRSGKNKVRLVKKR